MLSFAILPLYFNSTPVPKELVLSGRIRSPEEKFVVNIIVALLPAGHCAFTVNEITGVVLFDISVDVTSPKGTDVLESTEQLGTIILPFKVISSEYPL